MIDGHWFSSNHADPRAVALYLRHYSARRYRDGRPRRQFCPPGPKMVLLTQDARAVFVWHRPLMERLSGQTGVCCTLFRNEGSVLSSVLITEACGVAWRRWPDQRLFTYVADGKVRSTNPGYCFKQAGWRACGRNKDGRLTVLEIVPASDQEAAA